MPKPPFEKFIVLSQGPNQFLVQTTSPNELGRLLKEYSDKEFKEKTCDEPSLTVMTLSRCIFIEQAITKALEEANKEQ